MKKLLLFGLLLALGISIAVFVSLPKSVEVLDCSDIEKDCELIIIQETIKNCGNWYEGKKPYCESTTENLREVTLITDPANHIKSPFTDARYSIDVETPDIEAPWDLEFLPDGTALITQKGGKLVTYKDKEITIIADIPVENSASVGLMGLAIDPNYENNKYIYLYYTTSYNIKENEAQERTNYYVFSRISQFTFKDNALSNENILIDNIRGSIFHSGGRLEFGPDGKLYATTGDGGFPGESQDQNTLGGKILRMNSDGSIPTDNPFENSYIYSLGHKNPQGIAWDPVTEELFSTEHGGQMYDEINLVTKGANYGWPAKQCDELLPGNPISVLPEGLKDPLICFKDWTLAPSSMTFVDDKEHPWFGDLFVTGLRGRHLHSFKVEDGSIVKDEIFYVTKGSNETMDRRLRDVEFYDGSLWIVGDWNGIVKLSPLP